MNYQTWSKKKFWLVLIGVLLLGMLITPKNPIKEVPVEKIVTKEVPVEKVVTKEVAAQCDETNWKELKKLDDAAIGVAVEQLGYCAQGFTSISEGDIATLNSLAGKITANGDRVEELTKQRQAVLIKLGY